MNLKYLDGLNSEIRKQARFIDSRKEGDSSGKVSPNPILRHAGGDKRVKETHKNDGGEIRED